MVKLVYVGELLRMVGNFIKRVFPVHLVDRYSYMLVCGGTEKKSCAATGKKNMSKVSPRLGYWEYVKSGI